MNVHHTARLMRKSREQNIEVDESLSVGTLEYLAEELGVNKHVLYVSPGAGENLKISVPITTPIRTVPMGEKP